MIDYDLGRPAAWTRRGLESDEVDADLRDEIRLARHANSEKAAPFGGGLRRCLVTALRDL